MEATQENTQKGTKRALLIGIDYYDRQNTQLLPRVNKGGVTKAGRVNDLQGCVNDILAVREYLLDTMKVDPFHIHTLLAPVPGFRSPYAMPEEPYCEPTYKNIVGALEDLARVSNKGDVVYIHYSGHGALTNSVFGDLRRDKKEVDNCLVPCDVGYGGKYLRDLEVGALLQEIAEKGAILTVVFDSCHSGGAVRGEEDDENEDGVRSFRGTYQSSLKTDLPDPNNMERVKRWAHKPSWMEAPDTFVVLAACLEDQKAKEKSCRSDDEIPYKHGFLTYWLLDTLQSASMNISSQTIVDRVRSKVMDEAIDQTPNIAGQRNRFFFNEHRRTRIHTLTVEKLQINDAVLRERWVILTGGRMDAVKMGSVYAILPLEFDPGTKIQKSDILARVKVVKLLSKHCRARFDNPEKISDGQWKGLNEGCPAILEKLPIKAMSTVRFMPSGAEALQFESRWNEYIGKTTNLNRVNEDNADFKVDLDEKKNFRINHRGENFLPIIAHKLKRLAWDDKGSVPRLMTRLEHIARFKMLRGLENPGFIRGEIPELVSVSVHPSTEDFIRSLKTEDDDDDSDAESIEQSYLAAESTNLQRDGTYEVKQRRCFRIAVKNNSKRTVGCVVLDFNNEYGISRVHSSELFHSIKPGETYDQNIALVVPPHLIEVAEKGTPMIDVFKVFISIPEKDLDGMQLSNLIDKESDDRFRGDSTTDTLDDLLQELAPISRHGVGLQDRTKKEEDTDWQTVDVRVRTLL